MGSGKITTNCRVSQSSGGVEHDQKLAVFGRLMINADAKYDIDQKSTFRKNIWKRVTGEIIFAQTDMPTCMISTVQ